MRRVLALLALPLLLAGCGKRERLNPFDPGNPITHGRPARFEAIAGNALVRLSWNAPPSADLQGFQLYRRVEGESTYRAISSVLPVRTTTAGDFGLLNGVEHRYRLYYVFNGGIGALPAEDVATPGPMRPWVADGTRSSLVRLAADGRHVAFEEPDFPGAAGVAVDELGARVWVTEPGAGSVAIYEPATDRQTVISGLLDSPAAVALDPVDLTAWVCDPGSNQVFHFAPSGELVPPQLVSIDDPIDVAVDPVNRSVWVCERGANRVRRYDFSGALIGTATVTAPSRVAVDPSTHEAWVTSFQAGQVVRLSPSPAVLTVIGGFRGPIGVAVDPTEDGRIWVADALGNQVVALRRSDLSVEFRTAALSEVREIAVDPLTGEAWCTVPGIGAVARLSPAGGAVLQTAGGLASPDGIALGNGAP